MFYVSHALQEAQGSYHSMVDCQKNQNAHLDTKLPKPCLITTAQLAAYVVTKFRTPAIIDDSSLRYYKILLMQSKLLSLQLIITAGLKPFFRLILTKLHFKWISIDSLA